jgi:hypothetical protein
MKSRTAARLGCRLAAVRCIEGMVRREMRPPSDSKSPRPVLRRGLDCCDDEYLPVICPTEQEFF